ncbi:MAG: serine protease, partial [Thermoproteota archaeon]|nr:serine protease [Thermoproteota archaeon]
MSIEKFSPILHELGDIGILDYKNLIKIFELLKPYWVDSKSASCIYERALHPDISQAVALNASKSISAELCIRRASCRHPNMWPMCTPTDVFGADAADEIVNEILYDFLQQMLKTQDIDEIFPELDFNSMDPDQQKKELKSLICTYKTTNLQPVFFVFKYSDEILRLLPTVQENLPHVTLFLLTEDRYPNPADLVGFDCELLLDLGVKREYDMIRRINNTKSSFSMFRNNS